MVWGLVFLLLGFEVGDFCQSSICSALGLKQKHGQKSLAFWPLDKCNACEQNFSHLD